ncbi:MAG TPA: hypothetical protein PKM87_09355, partial [Methanolinea sp.]|nr:hypothetical protein [Methanolinea sp.]
DAAGNVYVTEWAANRTQKFSPSMTPAPTPTTVTRTPTAPLACAGLAGLAIAMLLRARKGLE